MSVVLCTNPSDFSSSACEKLYEKPSERSSRNLTIGLINNMPDSALEATERQFTRLLASASDGITIRLRLYSLPGIPRMGMSANRVRDLYSSTEELLGAHVDGIIVTGREPLAPSLREEPYWDAFTDVVHWARNNTHSTVWSCLAAHAAVLYEDDVQRIKNTNKHFGVFECESVAKHFLTAGISSRFRVPHSRWNGLPEKELAERGYQILSRAAGAGVDIFAKQYRSMFVFFQGHPEYEANTMQLEYLRDIGRFFRGEIAFYPPPPKNYFDAESQARLEQLDQIAATRQREVSHANVLEILESVKLESTWRAAAANIYRNWLEYICSRKLYGLRAASVTQEDTALGLVGSYGNEAELSVCLAPAQTEITVPRELEI